MLSRRGTLILIIAFSALAVTLLSQQFMLVRIRENSMAPTLHDGQWVLVRRGANRVSSGDVAVFICPLDGDMSIKRCILEEQDAVRVEHGWLKTSWGDWFLTDEQWNALLQTQPREGIYMVGDNQFSSLDSRTYGPVSRERVLGRVILLNKDSIHG